MKITSDNDNISSGKLPRALYKLTINGEPTGSVSRNGNRMIKVHYYIVDICVDKKDGLEWVIGVPITDYVLVEQGKHQKLESLLRSLKVNINNVEFNDITGEPTFEVDETTGQSIPITFNGKEVYAICESVPIPITDDFGNPIRSPEEGIAINGYRHQIVRYV